MDLDEAMKVIRGGLGREFCPRMADVFLAETEARRERIIDLQAKNGAIADPNRMSLDRGAPVPVSI